MVHEKRLAKLHEAQAPIELDDSLPEAGCKVLTANFATILSCAFVSETDSLAGDEIFIAARRAYHVFDSLSDYYKAKTIKPFTAVLSELVATLQTIKQYQSLLADLKPYHSILSDESAAAFAAVVASVQKKVEKAEKGLYKQFASKPYDKFIKAFTKFLLKAGEGTITPDSTVEPYEVRHLAPVLLHLYLATVRAYDSAIIEGDSSILVDLYAAVVDLCDEVAFFEPLLGNSVADFVVKLTVVRDMLTTINHADFAADVLMSLKKLDDTQIALIETYLADLQNKAEQARTTLPEAWASFNTRTAQRNFSDALLVLR